MPTRESTINGILNLLDLTFVDERARAKPSLYGVAVTTLCNLECPHCMREALGIRENLPMDYDIFASHSGALRHARRISLYGLGEPLLHPRLFDFIKLCREIGVESQTLTHGMSLTPEVREEIVESGLGELTISMDGADKEVFDELRKNAVFETVVENVKALSALKAERGSELPIININMTVMRRNLHQVPGMVRLAKELGAQSLTFSSVVIYKPEDEHKSVADTPEFEKRIEQARRLSCKLGIPMTFFRQKPIGWRPDYHDPAGSYGCVFLWSNQIIERDGQMKLCCYIEEDIDDVFAHGPEAAFNGDRLRRERRALIKGKVRPECQGCMYLRERSPAWAQALINQAVERTMSQENAEALTEQDRAELLGAIAEVQSKKDALFPRHRYRPVMPEEARAAASADAGALGLANEELPPI